MKKDSRKNSQGRRGKDSARQGKSGSSASSDRTSSTSRYGRGSKGRGTGRSQDQGGTNPSKPRSAAAGSARPIRRKVEAGDLYKPNDGIRLNKYLADAGISSRRKADDLIKNGVVRINRKVVTDLSTRVNLEDFVTVNGDPVNAEKHLIYILLNKPKDIITTSHDEKNRKTVMDIVKPRERIYPVGRLDRNTTGLLLLTNDGELTNRVLHPSYQIQRTYNIGLNKELKFSHAEEIVKGIEIDVGTTAPCEIMIDPKDHKQLSITLIEGKNREVRKIFEKFGYDVRKLDRKYFGNLSTAGMKRGQFRHLTRKETMELKRLVKL
jgi:23S rRNA pseudouridine2605 synthase